MLIYSRNGKGANKIMKEDSLRLVNLISQAIFDKKGNNIIALDVRGVSSLTDFIIIAEGNVDRHVLAIANEIEKTLTDEGEKPLRVEGRQNGDWVILDYGVIMVHLFMPGIREKYQLEKLWSEGKLVELELTCISQSNEVQSNGSFG